MYTLIDGSNKNRVSNSKRFLNIVSEELDKYLIFNLKKDYYDDIIDSINISDAIILSFPLYVDSPPSNVLKFLDFLYDNNVFLEDKKLYSIINCGFREGKHNIMALEIIKNFCKQMNIDYRGAILIGAGEIVGSSKYKWLSSNAIKKLKKWRIDVGECKYTKEIITTMNLLNNSLYCFFANISWKRKIKKQ